MKVDIIEIDDWIALYVDGDLKLSGHTLNPVTLLQAVGVTASHQYIDFDHRKHEFNFAPRFEDAKLI